MKYWALTLEVPFGMGEFAEFDQDPSHWIDGVKPMSTIDLVLYTMSVPDLTTTDGIYFATPRLAQAMAHLTGLRSRAFTLSFDEQMLELGEFDDQTLPDLSCFEVVGSYGTDDFAHREGVTELLASERAMALLADFSLGSGTAALFRP
ncbi:hypothetical protein FHX49_000663 [Microbacterium endophyticum]|uniref:Uncharacterized protein n=1 Tax=Microbacterium endophyticum TaxID=1526412 RepID=A0A7W4V1G6_9MICO|nr:hypothetical protein [Microbacterium endophyticum]MBB2975122.1 hypothetical protein [Microbacterium endophyticum]NIK37338.1 hypothetical protein [Microbacterium endophyticum]